MQYFANSRHPATPSSTGRAGSSRNIPRTSDIDFDEVPSPRPRNSIRKSMSHTSGPGPSSLSKSVRARDLNSDSDPPNNDYGGMDNSVFDDASPQRGGSGGRTAHQETSFTLMDQDDDDDEGDQQNGHEEGDEEEEQSPPPLRRNKGKERALSEVPEEPGEGVEDNIAYGLEDVEQGASDDGDDVGEEEHPEPEPRRNKKAKFAVEEVKKPLGRPRGKSKKENRRESSESHLLRASD